MGFPSINRTFVALVMFAFCLFAAVLPATAMTCPPCPNCCTLETPCAGVELPLNPNTVLFCNYERYYRQNDDWAWAGVGGRVLSFRTLNTNHRREPET